MSVATIERAIEEHVAARLPGRIRNLIRWADLDLWGGPYSAGDFETMEGESDDGQYPGFSKACDEIRDALDEIGELWIEEDSECIMDREPEGEWLHPDTLDECDEGEGGEWFAPPPYYHFDRLEIARAVCGRELAPYVA